MTATPVTYRVLVDWNNDGDYGDSYETQQVFNTDGISIVAGRDQPRQYSPARIGEADWVADNRDNRFTDVTGLLGSNLKPFRRCKVQARYGTASLTQIDTWATTGNSTDHVKKGTKSYGVASAGLSGMLASDVDRDLSALADATRWACWVYVLEASAINYLEFRHLSDFGGSEFFYQVPGTALNNGWNRITGTKDDFVKRPGFEGTTNWNSITRSSIDVYGYAIASPPPPYKVWASDWAWGTVDATPETYVDLFTGTVDRWGVKVDQYPLITADFKALDALAQLASAKVYTALSTGITTDAAALIVLTAAGYTGDYALAPGYSTLGYWWADGQSALEALQDLATHEGGSIYVDGSGVLTFESRYTRYGQTADSETISDVHGLEFRSGVRDVVNRVSVTTAPRSLAVSRTDVWTASASLALAPNEARKITAHGSDPFSGALVPVSGTDFTVAVGGVASVSALSRTSGQTTEFTITADGSGCTLTGLKLRAFAVTAPITATWIAEDATSQTDYGLRAIEFDMPYLADANVGRDAASYYLARYSQPVDAVDLTIKAETRNDANTQILSVLKRQLGQRVRVAIAALDMDWSGFIETIKHRIRGERHESTFSIERLREQRVFTLDEDFLDSDATLGW